MYVSHLCGPRLISPSHEGGKVSLVCPGYPFSPQPDSELANLDYYDRTLGSRAWLERYARGPPKTVAGVLVVTRR